MMKGNLYLIPTPLADTVLQHVLPDFYRSIINHIDFYIVENTRTIRRFLKKSEIEKPIESLHFTEIGEHSQIKDYKTLLQPCLNGYHIGLLSEAGLPCVADPGCKVVAQAHQIGIKVVPLVGPSSIMMALMSSGFNGQNFCFHGYLSVERYERIKDIKHLENQSIKHQQTQIFIETPYRNNQMMETLIQNCYPETKICIALDLTSDTEEIYTKTIKEWKNTTFNFHKRPAVFLMSNNID